MEKQIPKKYQGTCSAAIHKSCWGTEVEGFAEVVCLENSGDCYYRLAGKPLGKKDIQKLTEPEIVKFKDHNTLINAWRLATN